MFASAVVYLGLIVAVAGALCVLKPIRRLRMGTRRRAAMVALAGVTIGGLGFVLPAPESRIARVDTHLDEFAPAWQFNEVHTIRIAAPPARVFEAIRGVTADEIALFRTLTWIRRGGRALPRSILNAGGSEPLIDVALRGGFVRLADDAPRELVIGAVVAAPPRHAWAPDAAGLSKDPASRVRAGVHEFSRHARRAERLARLHGDPRLCQ